jgi:hypothetical protein
MDHALCQGQYSARFETLSEMRTDIKKEKGVAGGNAWEPFKISEFMFNVQHVQRLVQGTGLVCGHAIGLS